MKYLKLESANFEFFLAEYEIDLDSFVKLDIYQSGISLVTGFLHTYKSEFEECRENFIEFKDLKNILSSGLLDYLRSNEPIFNIKNHYETANYIDLISYEEYESFNKFFWNNCFYFFIGSNLNLPQFAVYIFEHNYYIEFKNLSIKTQITEAEAKNVVKIFKI